nr:reverse transcriptase domain-containing protein [Tanacetum cinerariifolium]
MFGVSLKRYGVGSQVNELSVSGLHPKQDIAKLTHAVNEQTSAVTTAMTAILKQFQATPPPASIKVVEEICVTCGSDHSYYQCLATGGNIFPELRDNIQGYVLAAAVNYNQGNSIYRPSGSGSLPPNTVANPKGELKAITIQSGLVIDGPTVPTPPPFINPKVDERVEETLTYSDLFEYTIKIPPPPVQKYKPPSQRDYIVHQRDHLHPNIPYPLRMLKQKQQEKDEKESINLINIFNNSSEDFLEDLFSTNQPSSNPTFLPHTELTSLEVKDDIFDLEGGNVLPEKLLDLDSTKDLHPPLHVNPFSGSTTYSSSPLLEEFIDELAFITFPLKYDDDLQFDVEFDLKEIESLLYQDIDSSLKDSIDQSNLANHADNFVDSMPEMFTNEHAPDYSSLPIFDEYDDDFLEVESDTKKVYDDPFDFKGEKIKESKLLVDELDLLCDFLPSEYDSFIS